MSVRDRFSIGRRIKHTRHRDNADSAAPAFHDDSTITNIHIACTQTAEMRMTNCDITSTERHLCHYRIDKECDKSNNVTRPPNPKTTTQQQKKEGKFLFVARSNEWQTNRNHFILPHVHSCIIDGGFFCFWFGIENCIDRLHSCIYGRYDYSRLPLRQFGRLKSKRAA